MANNNFTIDQQRLDDITRIACEAVRDRFGVFAKGLERFIPQYNVPDELEDKRIPPKIKESKKRHTGHYFWTSAYFERMIKSSVLMGKMRQLWKEVNWFFWPEQVLRHQDWEVDSVMRDGVGFALPHATEYYINNAKRLIDNYGGDPRNLIEGRTIAEARAELEQFQGIASGIANLFILYMLDRRVATPTDPENLLLKVDRHKARILLNTNAIVTEADWLRRDTIPPKAEPAYRDSCHRQDLDPSVLDSALWVIGSEVCTKRDLNYCQKNCPFAQDYCVGYAPEEEATTRFHVHDQGERVDPRKSLERGPLI